MLTLVIDASSPTLYVGVVEGDNWRVLKEKNIGALEGLFDISKEIFKDYPLEKMEKIVLCEGPGRLMSLRVAAVAANEWTRGTEIKKEVYNSLELTSLQTGMPAGYFVRENAYVAWIDGKAKIVSEKEKPEGLTIINDKNYLYRIDELPRCLEKISMPVEMFAPPTFAPSDYAVAKNFSKK